MTLLESMANRFHLSSSSSYHSDDNTATTAYTNEYSDYYNKSRRNSKGDFKPSKLIREAEDFINKSMQNMGIQELFPINCGVEQFKKKSASCGLQQFQNKRRNGCNGGGNDIDDDVDIDEGIQLDWRKDPYNSMSDFTLIVRDGTNKQPQSYHIHKSVVSYGNRKSGFLFKLFEREILEGGGHNRGGGATEMALPKRAAEFVPHLLDYIYFDIIDLNAECAPPIRHLANIFDVRELYALVSSFIQNDLNEETITTYILEAEAVKDKELLGLSMSIAASKFEQISDASLLQLQPHVFQQLTSNQQLNCPSSERLSQRIAVYSRGRSDEINDEVFYFMTHAQILPSICPSEAMWFLNFASNKFANVLVDDSMGGYEGTLKHRCIVAAAQDWKNILLQSVKEEVKRKVNSNGGNIGSIIGGDSARRRLFVDGDDEAKIDKGRGYMSLPLDIRIDLLEEALLMAASTEKDDITPHYTGITSPGVDNNEYVEARADMAKVNSYKGRRDRRQMF